MQDVYVAMSHGMFPFCVTEDSLTCLGMHIHTGVFLSIVRFTSDVLMVQVKRTRPNGCPRRQMPSNSVQM